MPELRSSIKLRCALAGAAVGLIATALLVPKAATNAEVSLLAPGTSTLFERVDGNLIHCRDQRDADACVNGFQQRGNHSVTLLLGNSQLHAINQLKPDEAATSSRLFHALQPRGTDVITFSYGNANIQEHAVLFAYLIGALPVRALALALVFDDTREDGVRSDVAVFADRPEVAKVLAQYAIGRDIMRTSAPAETTTATPTGASMQGHVEESINARLEQLVPPWRNRGEMRYQIFKNLRSFRNLAFGITPSTTRRIIPAVYGNNLAALEMILDVAKSRGIGVLTYVAPIRNDIPLPYASSEYLAFKARARSLAERYSARFEDYENLVPAQYWGLKDSTTLSSQLELDFMHFTSNGHAILAARLANDLNAMFDDGCCSTR
jgi:hypothetical protein